MNNDQLYRVLKELEAAQIIRKKAGVYELKHDSLAAKISKKRTAEQQSLNEWYSLVKQNRRDGMLTELQLEYVTQLRSKFAAKYENEHIKEECERFIDSCIAKYNAEKEEKKQQSLREDRLKKKAQLYLYILVSAAAFVFALGAFIFLKSSLNLNKDTFTEIRDAYISGDQRTAVAKIADYKAKNSSWINRLRYFPWEQKTSKKISDFEKSKFFFSSFRDVEQNMVSAYGIYQRGIQERVQGVVILKLWNIKGRNRINIYNDTGAISSNFRFIDSLFIYPKEDKIIVYNVLRKKVVKRLKFSGGQSLTDVKMDVDPTKSYLYATLPKENVLAVFALYNEPSVVFEGNTMLNSRKSTLLSQSFSFPEKNKILSIRSRSGKQDLITLWDIIKNDTQHLSIEPVQYAFGLVKPRTMLFCTVNGGAYIVNVDSLSVKQTYKNVLTELYDQSPVVDSTAFPIYISNERGGVNSIIYSCSENRKLDVVEGKVENLQVSKDNTQMLYFLNGIPYLKEFQGDSFSFAELKSTIASYGFFRNDPYFISYSPETNSFGLSIYDQGKQKRFHKSIPYADKWLWAGQKGDELLFESTAYGYIAIFNPK